MVALFWVSVKLVEVQGNPVSFIDPFGLAQVCRRALEGWPGMTGDLHHSQIFYDDGPDSGFFNDDTIGNDTRHSRDAYQCEGTEFDDKKLRDAERKVQENWDMDWRMPLTGGWNNCQDYTDAVVDQYMDTLIDSLLPNN